jgi:hypothetical protein
VIVVFRRRSICRSRFLRTCVCVPVWDAAADKELFGAFNSEMPLMFIKRDAQLRVIVMRPFNKGNSFRNMKIKLFNAKNSIRVLFKSETDVFSFSACCNEQLGNYVVFS